MKHILYKLCDYCIKHGIITEKQQEWFVYGVERRVTTLIVLIPFIVISILFLGIEVTVAYLGSFFFLRKRLNGFHARSLGLCFLFSIITEVLFLFVIFPILYNWVMWVLMALDVVAIFWLAPYNHPNMNFSKQEYSACRISSHIRALLTVFAFLILSIANLKEMAKGIVLGTTMAAWLLCVAYINIDKESTNKKSNPK